MIKLRDLYRINKDRRMVRRWLRSAPRMTPDGFLLSGYKAYFSDTWEAQERQYLKKVLPTMDLFINFGANHGFYCCLALAHNVATIAFEPVPENCAVIAKNIQANGWGEDFSLFPVAVSNRTGLSEIYGLNRTTESLIKEFPKHSNLKSQTVPVHRIDDIISPNLLQKKKAFVLMDIEGSEVAALEGAKTLLAARPKPIWMIEVLDLAMAGKDSHASRVFEIMLAAGYSAYAFNGRSGLERISPKSGFFDASDGAQPPARNFVFCEDI